jgi:hypothetical protein
MSQKGELEQPVIVKNDKQDLEYSDLKRLLNDAKQKIAVQKEFLGEIKTVNTILPPTMNERKQEDYEDVIPELFQKIEDRISNSNIIYSGKWDRHSGASKVTDHLGACLNYLLSLCYKKVQKVELEQVAQRLKGLLDSYYFKQLPYNYPYRKLATETQVKIATLIEKMDDTGVIFQLSEERRSEFMAFIYTTHEYNPLKKLEELEKLL